MDKGEYRHSTSIHFGTFIVFDLHKQLAKWFTVWSWNFLLTTFLYFLLYKISSQAMPVQTMILDFNPDPRK